MNKFRKNDSVKVIAGSYKGQTGRVLKMISSKNRISFPTAPVAPTIVKL